MTTNRSFQTMITGLRRAMPWIAACMLIAVYIVSAVAQGMLLQTLMQSLAIGSIMAYCISFAIQLTRATLVFFPQLNPNRPSFSYAGETIAIIMGIVAIGEIIGLVFASTLALPVAISLAVLMAMGIAVEIYLLKEVRHSTEAELMNNPAAVQNVYDFHRNRAELKAKLEEIQDYAARGQMLPSPSPSSANNSNGIEAKQMAPFTFKDEQGNTHFIPDSLLNSLGISNGNEKPKIELAPELVLNGTSKNGNGAHH